MPRRLPTPVVFAALGALVAGAYGNALPGAFHFDDFHSIENNPAIRSLSNPGRFLTDSSAFTVLPQNQNYRPLVALSYAATAQLFGVTPGPFVAGNLLVHALCAVLVFTSVRRTRALLGFEAPAGQPDWVAVVAAALFAVHPLFSECVNYVSARSESLSAALTLLALLAYLKARDATARFPEWPWLAAAALMLFTAITTKLVAASFLLPLAAFELAAAQRQPLRRVSLRLAAMAASTVGASVLAMKMMPKVAVAAASAYTPMQYLRSELPAYFHYLRLFVAPYGQSADPSFPLAGSILEARVLAAAAALLAVIALSAYGLLRRRHAGAALAATWFLACLAPTSSVAPLAELVNEHRPYLAAAALCAVLAEVLVRWLPERLRLQPPARTALVSAAVSALVVGYGALTVVRNPVWRSEESLWKDVVTKGPGSARAQMNYGRALMARGRLAEAEPFLREAVRLGPQYGYARINLGVLLLNRGESSPALDELDRAVAVSPDLFWAHHFRGIAAQKLGEPPQKVAGHFARAVALSPGFAEAHYHLALAREAMGDGAGALAAARRAVALRGSFEDRFMLAFELLRAGDAASAAPMLSAMAAERPDDTKVKLNAEIAKRMLGEAASAPLRAGEGAPR